MNHLALLAAQSITPPVASVTPATAPSAPTPVGPAFDTNRLERLLREGKRLNAAVRSALTPGVRVGGHIRQAARLALIDDLMRYQERLEQALADLRPLVEAQQQRARALTLYSRALNNAYLPSYRRGTR
ncbi:hypothetical protein [Nitrospirillum pindoramense]|uniref:Uncharacterized protein n=1 Tax=Nitrospirillum amazonense TaxID=28077 RepID=A0A560HAB2_9PROT|nr:hypothetical protein [Nitrospirillum amazonense]TWB42430.1 hypothetical protein FBZ90_10624 [Nitrospirillum amazonense]